MNLEFKTPSIKEYEDILDLWDECDLPYKPEGRDTREKIANEIRKQPEYWIGAYDDQTLVGIIVGTDDGRKGWINRLAVDEKYRGKGIGTKLVKLLEQEFEDNGFKIWAALIEPDNPEAMEFFEKKGFEDLDIKYYSKRESDKV
ncbi:MAG: GNAT family N-acetyltransferase [Thermoplasmata archaeon]